MDNSLYIAISKQKALQQQMNLVANNIANMNTSGYRAQHVLFEEVLRDQDSIADVNDPISLVHNYGQYDDTSAGAVNVTGNTLDVALQGPGFLGVLTEGGIEYTRAGNLSVNAQGELITASGFRVASQGGAPIIIPEGETQITIEKNGAISTPDGEVGSLMISEFDDYQLMTPQGNGLYKTEGQPRPATETTAIQGAIEGSNVNPIMEMTRMIEISRKYQSTQRFIQNEHDMRSDSIKKLARVQ